MVYVAADFWDVRGGNPARLKLAVFGARRKVIASQRESGARGEDADIEMGRQRVQKGGVVEAAVGLPTGREEV